MEIPPSRATGITIRGNSMFSNGELAIDLSIPGADANDPLDADPGPNRRMNSPEWDPTSVFWDPATELLTLAYRVDALSVYASYTIIVDFYVVDADDEEPETFVTTHRQLAYPAPGDYVIVSAAPVAGVTITAGTRLVALATDSDGNTSEASGVVVVPEPGFGTGLAVTLLGLWALHSTGRPAARRGNEANGECAGP